MYSIDEVRLVMRRLQEIIDSRQESTADKLRAAEILCTIFSLFKDV